MEFSAKTALVPDKMSEYNPDSFIAVPRDADTAVVYWSLSNRHLPFHEEGRLCLRVLGETSDIEETIILYREAGHFIIPLISEERRYVLQLGWSDVNGFSEIFTERIVLPDPIAPETMGTHASAIDYRGSVFWGNSTSAN